MNPRPSVASRQSSRNQPQAHQISSSPLSLSLSRISSRSITPSKRGDLPLHRPSSSQRTSASTSNQPFPQVMVDQPITPTPKKPGRRRRKPDTRPSDQRTENANEVEESGDDEALLDLLGVASPPLDGKKEMGPIPGMLQVTRADIKASEKKATTSDSEPERGGRPGKQQNIGIASPTPRLQAGKQRGSDQERGNSEGEGKGKGKGKGRKAKQVTNGNPPSGLSLTKPKAAKSAIIDPNAMSQAHSSEGAFGVSSLSRSLPTSSFMLPLSQLKAGGNGRKAEEDESAVWDMPENYGPAAGTQEMTWQQKLQPSETPRRNAKSTPSDRRSKVPTQTHTQTRSSQPVNPLSTNTIPKYNMFPTQNNLQTYTIQPQVNPRTEMPRRLSLESIPPQPHTPIKSELFPRIKPSPYPSSHTQPYPHTAVSGIAYAGPTFHNSPHGANLPKPDLEDF